MKKFFFSLDTVLKYKEQILENLRSEHARILMDVRECEQRIEQLEEDRYSWGKELDASRRKGVTINEIRTYENYIEALRLKIGREKIRLAELRQKEEEKKNEVVEAKKETSTIEKLKERKFEEYKKQGQKEEEIFIEEFVSTKNALEKLR